MKYTVKLRYQKTLDVEADNPAEALERYMAALSIVDSDWKPEIIPHTVEKPVPAPGSPPYVGDFPPSQDGEWDGEDDDFDMDDDEDEEDEDEDDEE